MFRSYLKTAYRFLIKNKTFSIINIFGLAVGTLSCLYIVMYVQDQFSYDRQHKDAGDIYRVTTDLLLSGDRHQMATASPPIAPAMRKDFPEVAQYTRVVPTLGIAKHLLKYEDKGIYEDKVLFVDSTFFDIFTYHFVDGRPEGALTRPNTMVLLKPVAEKLFGKDDPVGKVVTMEDGDGKLNLTVTGVVDQSLGKTHLDASLFITMRSGPWGNFVLGNSAWAGNNFAYSYVKLRPGTNPANLEKKLPSFLDKYGERQLKAIGMKKELHLQPIRLIHTSTGYEVDPSKTVGTTFLYLLLLIAALIQVIACINFMNLSTARASNRAKEVGVRKVVGAGRGQLIRQFLAESFFMSLLSVLVALPLLILLLPYLNGITQAEVHLSLFTDYRLWLMLVGVVIVTGLLAGSYPAFYLSAFEAMKVIKGNFTNQVSAAGVRRVLVVFQFVLSIVLISGIIVIDSQLRYINHKDLGFDKSQRLIFNFYTDDELGKIPSFTADLRQLAEVREVSLADAYLGGDVLRDHGVHLAGGTMETAVDTKDIATDEHFVKATGIRLVSGRDFFPGDSMRTIHNSGQGTVHTTQGTVLINETLARRLGLNPSTAPGTRLYWEFPSEGNVSVLIAGVMKDFNFNSLRKDVAPFMLVYEPDRGDLSNLIVATSSNDYHELLGRIKAIWRKEFSGVPFEYTFLDEEVQKQYQSEIMLSHILNSFTLVAILISCLGLFGLAAFSAEQRVKEIGIRKVLGAGVPGLVRLLSRDFLVLVAVSLVIATPIGWWAMDKWLQSFVYRVSLSWWMFALAGMLAIGIAVCTVSFQAIRAAMANPIRSLRSE